MSHLSYMEKLLDGVEVEWLPLGEIGQFIRGNGLQKKDFIETGFPAIHYGQIYTKYGLSADETFTYISEELAKKLRKAEKNDLLLATTSENDDDVVKPLAWLGNQSAISGDMMLFRHEQNVKYLAHYFLTEAFQAQKRKYITGAKVRRVSSGDLSKIVVPIPCPDNPEKSLAIQAEIVRILDAFTAMTAELTAELNMRKKQYNYYRDQLLSFEEGEVEWKTLGDLTTDKFWIMPATPKFDENEDVPYITSKNIRGGDIFFDKVKFISRDDFNNLSRNRPILAGDFLISMIGTIGEIARVKKTDLDFYGQNMYLIRLDESLLHSGYFLHFFDSPKMKSHFNAVKNNSGQGYLKANNIDCISVPVPSLSEQKRIAAILDKFDALTNSITEGLPREIELRQKQYEYYRDLLLSFSASPAGGPKSHSDEAA